MRHTCSTCGYYKNGTLMTENPCKTCEVLTVNEFSNWQPIPITNADRIRCMTDEELTNWVVEVYHGTHEPYFSIRKIIEQGRKEFAEWLKGEIE